MNFDEGYDSFQNHADIWYRLEAKSMIFLLENAVINEEDELARIEHWANKNVEKGGSKSMKINAKLKLLYENRRQEQVGMYLRNQNLNN